MKIDKHGDRTDVDLVMRKLDPENVVGNGKSSES